MAPGETFSVTTQRLDRVETPGEGANAVVKVNLHPPVEEPGAGVTNGIAFELDTEGIRSNEIQDGTSMLKGGKLNRILEIMEVAERELRIIVTDLLSSGVTLTDILRANSQVGLRRKYEEALTSYGVKLAVHNI